MKSSHLFLSLAIVAATTLAWFILGKAVSERTADSSNAMSHEVAGVWGPPLIQEHPHAWFATPNALGGKARLLPKESKVAISLASEPKRRGLLWHRTYRAKFGADYVFANPTRVAQTLYLNVPVPEEAGGLRDFEFQVDAAGESNGSATPRNGIIQQAVVVDAGQEVSVRLGYVTNGTGHWRYEFSDASRVSGFTLDMETDFEEINFPVGTGSPTSRELGGGQWRLSWSFPDVLSAPNIGMDMPKVLNAGPVAARIAFFAPVSLLLFVTVVLLVGGLKGIRLHPMHVFFVSAGFFGFHLLFAYLVDLLPLYWSFGVATLVSVMLVCGYLRAVGGGGLLRVAFPAQLTYLVLFSFSFFFDGLTGIVLAVVSVATLGLLMVLTAKVDWSIAFSANNANSQGRAPVTDRNAPAAG